MHAVLAKGYKLKNMETSGPQPPFRSLEGTREHQGRSGYFEVLQFKQTVRAATVTSLERTREHQGHSGHFEALQPLENG
jgi:hypothetical protein